MYTTFVDYANGEPAYLPGPFTAEEIATNVGKDVCAVISVAYRLEIYTLFYNGKQAVTIMKEMQDVA